MRCFHGKYKREIPEEERVKDPDFDIDIYQLLASGIKFGLNFTDFYELDFVTLINLLEVYSPDAQKNKDPMHKYRKATQKDIDLIT